jgi:hypothetical protein
MRLFRTAAFVLAASLSAAPALAQDRIYRWVDAGGEVHYTNDPSSIPSARRPQARVTRGAELMVVQTRPDSPPPRPPAAPAEASTGAPAAAARPLDEGVPPPPGALTGDEARWRDQFKKAHGDVTRLEKAAQEDRARLADPAANGIPVVLDPRGGVKPNPELDRVKERLTRTEQDLDGARRKLDDLDRQASRESVPREWRR